MNKLKYNVWYIIGFRKVLVIHKIYKNTTWPSSNKTDLNMIPSERNVLGKNIYYAFNKLLKSAPNNTNHLLIGS